MRPDYRNQQPSSPNSAARTAQVAFRIAQAWPDTIPSVDTMMAEFRMSRATAYRWIAALKEARGLPA